MHNTMQMKPYKAAIIYIVSTIQGIILSRLTVVSCKAKKKQHTCASSGLRDHYSELFIWMAALKFENAVTQPP